ncbi:hypothetical protein LOZ51_001040 [Ophidiomyces ophidiicola]|nr:hypothetical protein LOZ55_000041 [Ophidiomyces ophidiicola]KAI1994713.1 hypothetical protein LOZ54_000948 [Ophidiomyces ophidiicola]KAI2000755.1 hypothetical protein LOZ51_001040 [Ophidiomyces ophidiicola]
MRMGRPGRSDSQRKENIASKKRRQQSNCASNPSFLGYGATQRKMSLVEVASTSSPPTTGDTVASCSQGINGSSSDLSSHLALAEMQQAADAEFGAFHFLEKENCESQMDTISWLNYDRVEMNIPPILNGYDFLTSRLELDGPHEPQVGTMQENVQSSPSPNQGSDSGFHYIFSGITPSDAKSSIDVEDTTVLEMHYMYQDSLDRLAQLNNDLNQQLKAQPGADLPLTPQDTVATSLSDTQLPIAHIIRGLQEFQDLLQNIVNVQKRQREIDPKSNALTSKSGTPVHEVREDSSIESSHSVAISESPSSSNDLLLPIAESSPRIDKDARQTLRPSLDLPTCLSMLLCYINLVRLCRTVFSNICQCLITLDHRAISNALSDIQISGVLLQGDQSLQILILLQVVIRLLDCIGLMLGHTNSNNDSQGNAEDKSQALISQNLLETVMFEEEMDRQGMYSGGIRALREDIRRLKRVLKHT